MHSSNKKEVKFFVLDITLRGGIERFIVNMATLFIQSGHPVTVYSFHRTHFEPLYAMHNDVKIIYLTQISFINGFYKLSTLWSCFKLAAMRLNFRPPYVVISTHPITTILLSIFSRKLLEQTIASEHSTYHSHGALIRFMRLRVYGRAKFVVTQTADGVLNFRKAGLSVIQIPNPCTDFCDEDQWALEKNFRRTGAFTCLSIGRFESVKQLNHYIEAARMVHVRCPDVRFDLVGAGPLEEQLRFQIKQSRLESVFTIHGPTANVNAFYKKAHVYLITSKSEAFPMTMIEALSFGVPVLSYNKLVGPIEIIKHHFNGYLCEQDQPVALAEQILNLYHDRTTLKRMSEMAVQSSMSFYPKTVVYQWFSII